MIFVKYKISIVAGPFQMKCCLTVGLSNDTIRLVFSYKGQGPSTAGIRCEFPPLILKMLQRLEQIQLVAHHKCIGIQSENTARSVFTFTRPTKRTMFEGNILLYFTEFSRRAVSWWSQMGSIIPHNLLQHSEQWPKKTLFTDTRLVIQPRWMPGRMRPKRAKTHGSFVCVPCVISN